MEDREENKQKLLRLIEGGKAPDSGNLSKAPGKVIAGRVGKADSGLTLKQEAFAQALAKGATNSEAYRGAYNTENMAEQTVWQEACKLAANPKVADRVNAICDEKRRVAQRAAVKAEDRVNAKAWAMIEDPATPPAVVANLLNLMAKVNGMLTDKVEINAPHKAEDIETELMERLKRYASD